MAPKRKRGVQKEDADVELGAKTIKIEKLFG